MCSPPAGEGLRRPHRPRGGSREPARRQYPIGVSACKNAAPDGYTICIFSSSTIILRTLLDPAMLETRELLPVSNIVLARTILLVRDSVPAKTYAELVSYSKQYPDKPHSARSASMANLM